MGGFAVLHSKLNSFGYWTVGQIGDGLMNSDKLPIYTFTRHK